VNADLIAERLSPRAPESAAIASGRLMLKEIELLADQGVDFGFETTLAGRVHLKLLRKLKQKAYEVHFFYLWLPSVELAISRVRERVLQGGHDIPVEVVQRRFQRSFGNFWNYYRHVADGWTLFNSERRPIVAASATGETIQLASH
jgi:predicted ABC-type ATPase